MREKNVSNICEWWQEMLCACHEGHQTLVKRFHARGGCSDPALWIEKWGELPLSVPVLAQKQNLTKFAFEGHQTMILVFWGWNIHTLENFWSCICRAYLYLYHLPISESHHCDRNFFFPTLPVASGTVWPQITTRRGPFFGNAGKYEKYIRNRYLSEIAINKHGWKRLPGKKLFGGEKNKILTTNVGTSWELHIEGTICNTIWNISNIWKMYMTFNVIIKKMLQMRDKIDKWRLISVKNYWRCCCRGSATSIGTFHPHHWILQPGGGAWVVQRDTYKCIPP